MKKHLSFFLFSLVISFGIFLTAVPVYATTDITSNITVNTTWTAASSTYLIKGDIVINSGVTLTIEPGTVIKFENSWAALYVNGTLDAQGTEASPIYFTSYKDDVRDDTNRDGSATTPSSGDWSFIKVGQYATTTLNHTVVRYGGGNYYDYMLYNYYGGTLTVLNSIVASSSKYGIAHSNGITNIATTTFNDNGEYGIYGYNSIGSMSITGSTFYDNSLAAAYLPFAQSFTLSNSNNLATGTGKRGFIMYASSLGANQTWQADTIPYIIPSSGFNVSSGKTLTINPGAIIKFENSSAYLMVNAGTLNAIGNSTSPIYFTSIKDDTAGGDTNADGSATSPSAGDWYQITTNSNGVANLQYATIRYGGGTYPNANIYNNSGTFNISTSTISNAYSYGVKHSAGTTNLSQSSLFGNGTQAYYNTSGATTTATNNFWGNSSGPYNAKYNSSGTGNAVSDYVSFTPWLYGTSSAPVLQGHITTDTDLTLPVYVVHGELIVDSGKKLTVKPNVVVKFENQASLTVNGTLYATSTSGNIAYFTSIKDDTVGGDTNGDSSATTPSAGDWGSITTNSGATTTLQWVNVKYGGYSTGANLYNNGLLTLYHAYIDDAATYGVKQVSGTTTIQNSEIVGSNYGVYASGGTGELPLSIVASDIHDNTTYGIYTSVHAYIDFCDIHDNTRGVKVAGDTTQMHSSNILDNTYGIWIESGNALITSNVISGNTELGINNFNGIGSVVNAQNNYWGDVDGPTGEGPGDYGDAISTYVNYDPWLTESHYILTDQFGNATSSVKNKRIYWQDSESLPMWEDSISTWNDLGHITFAEATTSEIDLQTASEDRSDAPYVAQYNYLVKPKLININHYYFDGYSDIDKENTLTHELGHSLGLGHSYWGNIMYYMVYSTTTLWEQDLWDYHYLWD